MNRRDFVLAKDTLDIKAYICFLINQYVRYIYFFSTYTLKLLFLRQLFVTSGCTLWTTFYYFLVFNFAGNLKHILFLISVGKIYHSTWNLMTIKNFIVFFALWILIKISSFLAFLIPGCAFWVWVGQVTIFHISLMPWGLLWTPLWTLFINLFFELLMMTREVGI